MLVLELDLGSTRLFGVCMLRLKDRWYSFMWYFKCLLVTKIFSTVRLIKIVRLSFSIVLVFGLTMSNLFWILNLTGSGIRSIKRLGWLDNLLESEISYFPTNCLRFPLACPPSGFSLYRWCAFITQELFALTFPRNLWYLPHELSYVLASQ